MAFDQDSYRRGVLDPAHDAKDVPSPDLFVRYGIDPRSSLTPGEFSARVTTVVKYWRTLGTTTKKYKRLVTALLAAHAELDRAGELTAAAFATRREAGQTQARETLRQRIEAIAKGSPCVPPSVLPVLAALADGLLDKREIRAELAKKSVTIIDPAWELPSGPPLPEAGSLRNSLATLGLRLSVEVVFGPTEIRKGFRVKQGFRLTAGGELTEDRLRATSKEYERRPQDERKPAAENVLSTLSKALAIPGLADALVRWEIVEQLRPDREAGMPPLAVARAAADLGLDESEAIELAATLAAEGRPGTSDRALNETRLVLDALGAGLLREAQGYLDALSSEDADKVRPQVDQALRRLAEIVAAADAAEASNRLEEAARLLASAVALAKDDTELAQRLSRIPPPPPDGVRISVQADRVHLGWEGSRALTGTVGYRVVRSAGGPAGSPDGGTIVAEGDANNATDEAPAVADAVFYTVFAGRGGPVWSPGAHAGPVRVLPLVTGFTVRADSTHSVTGEWTMHPGAERIDVLRTEPDGAAPPRPVPVRAGGHGGFNDADGLIAGVRYEYSATAVYRDAAGRPQIAEPVTAGVTPEAEPDVVSDLTVDLLDGTPMSAQVTWTEPVAGTVEIRTAETAPEPREGTLVALADAHRYGRPLPGTPRSDGRGRVGLEFTPSNGRAFLTALSVGNGHVRVGNTVPLEVINPVTRLRTLRRGDLVQLTWVWPPNTTAVRVRWWTDPELVESADVAAASTRRPRLPQEYPTGEFEWTHREYVDDGGAKIRVGLGAAVVHVQTVAGSPADRTYSAPVAAGVAARPPIVTYRMRTEGFLWFRRAVLVLTADRPCQAPPLVVVRGRHGARPVDRTDGSVVAQLEARDLPPHPVSLRLPARRADLPSLACFVVDAGPGRNVTLRRTSGG